MAKNPSLGGSSLIEDDFVVIQDCPAQRTELMLKPTPPLDRFGEQEGSELTVRTLFETEEASLLRYAFSLIGRRAVAEEIVQDVFLQLHARWDQIDSPKAWLVRSVRNGVYDYLRKNRRETLGSDDGHVSAASDDDQSPENLLLRAEATGALRKILNELDEMDRQLVKLKYFDGMKYREISEQTGLSVGNVGYRLHHILKELARRLRPLGIEKMS